MLVIKELTYSVEGRKILDIPSLDIKRGSHLLVAGGAGSGKTTLLNLISGLESIQGGKITIDKKDIHAAHPHEAEKFRSKNIGIIFQKTHLIPSLSAIENITIAQYLAGNPVSRLDAMRMLEKVGLKHKKDIMPGNLEPAERQCVAIARALINNPILILADEPISSSGNESGKKILDLLFELAEEEKSSLVITGLDKKIKKRFSNLINLGGEK